MHHAARVSKACSCRCKVYSAQYTLLTTRSSRSSSQQESLVVRTYFVTNVSAASLGSTPSSHSGLPSGLLIQRFSPALFAERVHLGHHVPLLPLRRQHHHHQPSPRPPRGYHHHGPFRGLPHTRARGGAQLRGTFQRRWVLRVDEHHRGQHVLPRCESSRKLWAVVARGFAAVAERTQGMALCALALGPTRSVGNVCT